MTLLLDNARLIGSPHPPTRVLLKHGTVIGIGDDLTGSARIDLEGRVVMPGLWEGHAHLAQHALARHRVDVAGASSAADAARLIAAAAHATPSSAEPIVAFGFRDGLWPDEPTAALLDAVAADRPVVVLSADLHCCWLNTEGLRRFSAPLGSTGVVREDDAFPITRAVSAVSQQTLDGWITGAAAEAASRGVVGIADFEMADNISEWSRRFADGFRTVRIAAAVYPDRLERAIADGYSTGQVVEGSDGRLTVGPFKVLTDGSLNTRTAFCVDPYPGLAGPFSRGVLTVAPDRLTELLEVSSRAGFLPAVHAIGDQANALALDAFERVGCGGRIEHAQLLRHSDFSRFARLGVAASVQPEHAMDDRDIAEHHWAGRTDRAFALRALLDAGAELILGSDAPVAPLDPWVTIAAAVSRARDGRVPWHPEQAITVEEAVRASTGGRSRVRVGEVADLVVLDDDPTTLDADRLRTLPVRATFVGGYLTHGAF